MANGDNQIDNYLTTIGWGRYQSQIFIICGTSVFNIMIWGYIVSLLLVRLGDNWNLERFELGIIGSIYGLGASLGSLFFGFLSDRFGRMFSFRVSILVVWVATLFVIFSFNMIMLSLVLFFIGAGASSDQVLSATILKEFISNKNTSILAVYTLFYRLGGATIAIIIIIVEVINPTIMSDWKIITIIIFFWNSAQLIQRQFMDETPKFLYSVGKLTKAEEVLRKISKKNKKLLEIKLTELEVTYNEEISEIPNKKSVKTLFIKENIKTTLLITIIGFLMAFANISIIIYAPTFLSKYTLTLRYTAILIQQLGGFLGSLAAGKMVKNRFGPKGALSLSSVLVGCYIYCFFLTFEILTVIIFLCLYQFIFQISLGAIWIIVPESFSTELRSTFIGWFMLWQGMAGVFAPIIIGVFIDFGGSPAAISVISFCHLASGILTLLLNSPKLLNKEENLI
ncbi:unnamed protein product [Blepharisma stoltei]|uniref:Major facilitator superfamily (MFS) profile domain-containing protein n=1 Tax=Blepharisma stoltei TaxID=1481888 RepID=A0AAU9KKS0_9CILI|nr:unnamed protein product [Blepharisma stoltei]